MGETLAKLFTALPALITATVSTLTILLAKWGAIRTAMEKYARKHGVRLTQECRTYNATITGDDLAFAREHDITAMLVKQKVLYETAHIALGPWDEYVVRFYQLQDETADDDDALTTYVTSERKVADTYDGTLSHETIRELMAEAISEEFKRYREGGVTRIDDFDGHRVRLRAKSADGNYAVKTQVTPLVNRTK